MEKKTMGSFIAALRKANGMTQKELAEKLNVSDKSVSRWERDEGTPDLSLIPVIAEIFHVTCDELLRGERKASGETDGAVHAEGTDPKGVKQRRWILTGSLSRYRTHSFIAMGIGTAGLIAAMIGNFGFLRAYIGFLVGAVFSLTSLICQTIFVNNAFLSVSDDSLNQDEVGRFRWSVIRTAELSIGLTMVLFGFTLPLVLYPIDTYAGLSAGSWFPTGVIWAGLVFLVFIVVCYFLNAVLLNQAIFTLNEKEEQIYRHNHRLKRKFALILTVITCLMWVGLLFVTSHWDAPALSHGTTFYDYESFISYMEQDLPYYYHNEYGSVVIEQAPAPDSAVTYYDEYGNEISEYEALHTALTDRDGNVVCEYMDRNNTVASIRFTEKDGSLLPITVITHDDLRGGQAKVNLICAAFAVVYLAEVLVTVIIYCKKRAR